MAINAGAAPSAANHPFVWKEAAALGLTAVARAVEITAKRDVWLAIGSEIEAARQGAKKAVTTAKGDKDAMEAAAVVDWAVVGAVP